jgi:hypothetical protein
VVACFSPRARRALLSLLSVIVSTASLGAEGWSALKSADEVESFLVKDSVDLDVQPPMHLVGKSGHPLSAKSSESVARVLEGLKDPTPAERTRCIFSPYVELRFRKGEEQVRAQICFTCDEVLVAHFPAGKQTGKKLRFAGFAPHRATLLAAAREAFPEDEVLKRESAEK